MNLVLETDRLLLREMKLSDAELLIINSQIEVNPVAPIDQNMTFGGGGFSGGGSGGNF